MRITGVGVCSAVHAKSQRQVGFGSKDEAVQKTPRQIAREAKAAARAAEEAEIAAQLANEPLQKAIREAEEAFHQEFGPSGDEAQSRMWEIFARLWN